MQFTVKDLGPMAYAEATELQRDLAERVSLGEERSALLLVEHPPVLTLGANFHESNLLLSMDEYRRHGVEIHRTDRGGDVTYHGPGQLVAYPIFDLRLIGQDLHRWLRDIEQAIILAIGDFGIEGRRFAPNTGVWVGDRKIAAIGIKVRKWISMHGLALNCDNDLAPFGTIVPCGIEGYGVTSLTQEAGCRITADEAKPALIGAFESLFGKDENG